MICGENMRYLPEFSSSLRRIKFPVLTLLLVLAVACGSAASAVPQESQTTDTSAPQPPVAAQATAAPIPTAQPDVEFRFQYAAKFVCGANARGTSNEFGSLISGVYETDVNIHNASATTARLRTKVVDVEVDKVVHFDTPNLPSNHGREIGCETILEVLQEGPPHPAAIGFLVIESTRSLDVTAVYTAGNIEAETEDENVESIDVEQIKERNIRK
jgi:hypothetical protein